MVFSLMRISQERVFWATEFFRYPLIPTDHRPPESVLFWGNFS